MKVVSGNLYRHKAPAFPASFGQGAPPSHYRCTVDGREYAWPYGTVFQASNNCDPEGGVANLSASPYPLIRCSVLRALEDQFEPVG